MLVSARELSLRLGVSIQTIYNLVRDGVLPRGFKVGRSRRWDAEEVISQLKNSKADINVPVSATNS